MSVTISMLTIQQFFSVFIIVLCSHYIRKVSIFHNMRKWNHNKHMSLVKPPNVKVPMCAINTEIIGDSVKGGNFYDRHYDRYNTANDRSAFGFQQPVTRVLAPGLQVAPGAAGAIPRARLGWLCLRTRS